MENLHSNLNSLPQNLDVEPWIIWSLYSENESNRLVALEEIKRTSCSNKILNEIQKLYKIECSGTCKKVIEEILQQIKENDKKISLPGNQELSPQTLKALLDNTSPQLIQALVNSMRKAPSAQLLEIWRETLLEEENPTIQEVGLSLLARFGQPSDANFALSFISSEQIPVVRAAFDLLYYQNQELFKNYISAALSSPNEELNLFAIRRLGKIDPQEAALFIESMLESNNPTIRHKAIPELMLLPFEISEKYFLRFIAREELPLLLVLAGLGITFNPKPDIPEKIYDILLYSTGIKAFILQLIIKTTITSIRSSGILNQSIEEYMSALKDRLEKIKSKLKICIALDELHSDNPDARISAAQELRNHIHDINIKNALELRYTNESDQEVKKALLLALGKTDPTENTINIETLQNDLVTAQFPKNPVEKQLALLATVKTKDTFKLIKHALSKLDFTLLKKIVLIEILRLYENFADKSDVVVLQTLIDQNEPTIIATVIRTIGKHFPELILKRVSSLVTHNDPRVKKAALELFLCHDKLGAIKYLQDMLNSTNSELKRNAVALLAWVDFPTAESILSKFVEHERDEKLLQQVVMIYASNISFNSMKDIYKICHNKDGTIVPGLKSAWLTALETAEQVLNIDRTELQTTIATQVREEIAYKAQFQPNYAFNVIKQSRKTAQTLARIEKEVEAAKTAYYFSIILKTCFWFLLAVGFPIWYYYHNFVAFPKSQGDQPYHGVLASETPNLASNTSFTPKSLKNQILTKINEFISQKKKKKESIE